MLVSLIKKDHALDMAVKCIMESCIDSCAVCAKYNRDEQMMDLPDDVEPCVSKRKLGDNACRLGIKEYFESI